MTNELKFEGGNSYIEEIKLAIGITNDEQLINQAIAVYWLLLSETVDNTVTILRENGQRARFGLTPEADRILKNE